jgi:Phage integrase family
MRGSVPYQRCSCRDPVTKRPLGKKCPDLKKKGHALGWFFRYDEPRVPGAPRRQPELGPFATQKEAEAELTTVLARLGGGGTSPDRAVKVAAYLDDYNEGKKNLKPRSKASNAEAFRLVWKPALGGMRLIDVRDYHVSQVVTAMELVNRPIPGDVKPEVREMLRRMNAARADDERRVLPEGEKRGKKSVKPLSPARIERLYAPWRAAMNAAVMTRKVGLSPCVGVELPRAAKVKPLAWTPPREKRWREGLVKRLRKAEAAKGGDLTTVEKFEIWASVAARPGPVMVWLPAHTGAFLDSIEGERLAALFVLAAYCGMRRDEIIGLTWPEVDLDAGVAYVRETGGGDGPKSESGVRVVALPAVVVKVLRAWRKQQARERLAFGPDWPDGDLVFTREDGSAVPGQWVSVRFEWLAHNADLPVVRFHDLRHGAASQAKAAGADTKYIAEQLGHSRTSFTDSAYVTLFAEVQAAAAEAAAAIVPRKGIAQDS